MSSTGLKTALAAGVKSKVALAVLAALLATGSAAAGTAAAASQGAFGQQVKAQVASCKAHLTTGVHGIGECVSDFAQQHGAQQRQQHSQSGKSNPGKSGSHGGPPSGTPGASNGQGHGHP
jgi:hypothetical protein